MTASSSLVAGRFRLGELLGTGGSAVVYAAEDLESGRPVALKVLHPFLAARPLARDAFLAEARRAQPLRHQHIVGVIDVGIDERPEQPIVWIALERAEGASLAEHVARHGPLRPADAVAVIGAVLDALSAAHEIGLIHRDVSPANIMVAASGRRIVGDSVRLLDFGLADASGRPTLGSDLLLNAEASGASGVIGNVDYMSPEQVRGLAVDERGDVYQAGAVLYFALTGTAPFARTGIESRMRAHLEAPPAVPSVAVPTVPRALDRIVVRAMLKDPDDRFATASDMRRALDEIGLTGATAPVARPAASTAPNTGVTRVLGATVAAAQGHDAVTVVQSAVPTSASSTHRGSRGWGAGLLGLIALIAVGGAVAFASAGDPAAVEPVPTSASPTPTPPPVVEAPTETESPPEQRQVPTLVLLTRDEAIAALAAAGLTVGDISVIDAPVHLDTVIESSAAAGEWLPVGTRVNIVVASGYNAVPAVSGLSAAEAEQAMQAAGFAPLIASRPALQSTPAGSIVGTDPGAGAVIAVGTQVVVWQAVAAEPTPEPTPSSTVAPTPTAAP